MIKVDTISIVYSHPSHGNATNSCINPVFNGLMTIPKYSSMD